MQCFIGGEPLTDFQARVRGQPLLRGQAQGLVARQALVDGAILLCKQAVVQGIMAAPPGQQQLVAGCQLQTIELRSEQVMRRMRMHASQVQQFEIEVGLILQDIDAQRQ
ncbi:hypothetical protein D3C85_880370 [compost metagenome]